MSASLFNDAYFRAFRLHGCYPTRAQIKESEKVLLRRRIMGRLLVIPALIIVVGMLTGLFALMFTDWFQDLTYTPEQLAEFHATEAMLSQITVTEHRTFQVACPALSMSSPDLARWMVYARSQGWTPYPAAGPGCVDP